MAEGRCNCASIKVSIPSMPEQSILCYCANCRRAGSSVGSLLYRLNETDVTIHDPGSNLKSYRDNDTKSGNAITRQFCGNCGCPVISLLGHGSPLVYVKAGLFEHLPAPGYQVFGHEKPSWMKVTKPGEGSS